MAPSQKWPARPTGAVAAVLAGMLLGALRAFVEEVGVRSDGDNFLASRWALQRREEDVPLRTTGIVALMLGILGVAVWVFVSANSSSSPEPNRGVRALQLASETPKAPDMEPGGLRMEFTYVAGAQFWSPAARAALDAAAVKFTANFVVDPPVTLNAVVTGFNEPANTTLASASSDLVTRQGFAPSLVQQKVTSGVDANGSAPDFSLTWNFGASWALGDVVGPEQFDFQSVAMREFAHAFGFASKVGPPGTNTGDSWTLYDAFLIDDEELAIIDSAFRWQDANNGNLLGEDGGLYFGGPNAVAILGRPAPLFTPNPWRPGQSIVNLASLPDGRTQLMSPAITPGPLPRGLDPLEFAMLQDLGYVMVDQPQASLQGVR